MSDKGDSQYLYPSENLKMPFYFLCCHGKFVTMSVMLTYLMLQIGLTKINFLSCFICTNFQWTEDRQGFLIQYLLDPD